MDTFHYISLTIQALIIYSFNIMLIFRVSSLCAHPSGTFLHNPTSEHTKKRRWKHNLQGEGKYVDMQ